MGTTNALNYLPESFIILNNISSFMVNLFLTGGKCTGLCMYLQYVSCHCKALTL